MEQLVKSVRCPRCSAVVKAAGTHAVCGRCGLSGRIGDAAAPATAPQTKPPAKAKDPLQITIDLRKAWPGNWGRGAKASAVLFLFVSAFFLGGMAGMAFEKARTDIGAGIQDVKSLTGDGQAAAANASGGSGLEADPALDDTVGAEEGDPDSITDPGDDPSGGAEGDADEESPDEAEGDGADAGEPNTTSDPQDGEGPPSGATRTVLDEDGVGEWESESITTQARLLRLDISYWGDRFFAIKFMQDGEVKPAATLGSSDQGDYVDRVRYLPLAPGEYTVRIDLGAGDVQDGPWSLKITEPVPEEALEPAISFSGRGDTGVGPVRLTGGHTFSFYSTTQGAAKAEVYTAGGEHLKGCSMGGTATSTDPVDETTTCSVSGETWVFIDVAAKSDPDGSVKWNLSVD